MVDFDELKNKAQGFVDQHADTVKGGITKAGDFVGSKIGDEKVDPIEEKLHDVVDTLAGRNENPPTPPAPPETDAPGS
jgi:hypothetical protein